MEVVSFLDALAYHHKQAAYHQAQSMRVLADYAIACEGEEFFDAEIAAAMRWTSRWTSDQIAMALDLASKLPRTLDALEKGEIDLCQARVLYDRTLPPSADQAAQVEDRVLAKAPEQTGAQLRQVDAIAQQVKMPEDPRTLDQIRADVVADLLLATPGQTSAVKVELYVTVSAATLMGLSEQPGELAGYGPITADLARELAGDATWRRLLTDPVTGEALKSGTSTYRPPAALRRFGWPRDRTCRFPGCTRQAHKSDLDHTVPFPLGSTSAANLGPFCRHHHRVKHRTAWQVSQPKPGRFRFRSPAGKTYQRDPEPVLGDLPPF